MTNGKWLAFVHGFNVDGQQGRGWNAEVFKRMHQLGSRARFIAVQWHGDTGGANYHAAVINAFKTSELLANRLSFASGDLIVAAHSLGNVVVGNAIAHENLNANKYFMVNAAVPMEAYDKTVRHDGPDTANGQRVVRDDWKDYWTDDINHKRIFASYWHQLFDTTSDNRSKLTWGDRFAGVRNVAYNFYSSGEDVVEDANLSEQVLPNLGALFWNWLVSSGTMRGGGEHAWIGQEIVKGSAAAFAADQGGWGYNFDLYVDDSNAPGANHGPRSPLHLTTHPLSDEELAQISFFKRFETDELHAPIDDANALPGINNTQQHASALADDIRIYELLATAIPSRSYAAAANELLALNQPGEPPRNFNMQGMQAAWPPAAIQIDQPSQWPNGRWRHSDFKDIALRYVYPMYQRMLDIGELSAN